MSLIILPSKQCNQTVTRPRYSELTPRELKLFRALNSVDQLRRAANVNRTVQKSHIGKDGFEVRLNVENFKPEEVLIKTIDDSIIIEAKCERKSDNEYVSSQYRRRYELPSGFRAKDVVSTMSSDGVLTIKCPRASVDNSSVRQIEIKQTGPVRQRRSTEENEKNDSTEEEQPAARCRVF